jgi:hypothetical protein
MTSESDPIPKNELTSDAGRADVQDSANSGISQTSGIAPPPTKRDCQITLKSEKGFWDNVKTGAEIFGIVLLAVYTVYTIKMYHANKTAADAAKSAADTADHTLKNSQMSFEIDQRPYLITDVPQFTGDGLVPDKGIEANITFRNIGRTPARKYIANVNLFRFEPSKGTKGLERLRRFLISSFDMLESEDATGRKEVEQTGAEQDIAPNGTIFSTNAKPVVISAQEFPKIETGDIALFILG